MNIVSGITIDDYKVDNYSKLIEKLYQQNGYYFINLKTKIKINNNNVNLEFEINEGPRVYIKDIYIIGNNKVSTFRLKRLIKSKQKKIWNNGFLRKSLLEKDIVLIENYYRKKKLEAIVDNIVMHFHPFRKWVILTYKIIEKKNQESKMLANNENNLDALMDNEDVYKRISFYENEFDSNLKAQVSNDTELSLKIYEEKIKELTLLLKEKEDNEILLNKKFNKEIDNNKNINSQNIELKNKIESLVKEKQDLTFKIEKLEKELDDKIKNELDLKNQRDLILSNYTNLKQVIIDKLDSLEAVSKDLNGILNNTKNDIKAELEKVELKSIRVNVNKDEIPLMPFTENDSALEGFISVINDKLGFVVIDIGLDKGVFKGMTFNVIRDKKIIGVLKVIEVRKNISAADIIKSSTNLNINDKIVQNLEHNN